jgi:hypothetical protein
MTINDNFIFLTIGFSLGFVRCPKPVFAEIDAFLGSIVFFGAQ